MQQFNTINELEQKSKEILKEPIFDFIAGGAGSEWGVKNNNDAFNRYQIVPRVLQGVGEIDTSIEVLGTSIASPVIVGPCAFHKLVHDEGELATAKACHKSQTIMTLSTMSSYSIEEVAASSSFAKWFQLYVFKDKLITGKLIKRAEKAGFKALVVTVDVPAMGLRLRDINNEFSLSSSIVAANFVEEKLDSLSVKTDGSKVKEYTDQQFDSDLTWESIAWIRSVTSLPIILKGILSTEDALEAIKHHVSGIIISNHGGRQIDSVVSSLDVLARLAKITQGQIPLFLDGGIRSGEDIFKSIALGATAVLIARPVMWSLAIGGESQLINLLKKLQSELVLIMRLSGCRSLKVIQERGLSLLAGEGVLNYKLEELAAKFNQLLIEQFIQSQNKSTIEKHHLEDSQNPLLSFFRIKM